MSIVYESFLPASVEDVFAWHERPGGFARLLPPWQPMRVVEETESLGHGEAILGLPLGLRWVARHRDCVPERSFVDDLVLPGFAAGRLWSHVHEFEPVGEHQTRMIDRVTTPAPGPSWRPRSHTATASSPPTWPPMPSPAMRA